MIRLSIIAFKIKRKENNIATKDANRFYRKLYGYNNWSCYSRYRTFVKGFIHDINALRISKSTLLVPYKNQNQLLQYLIKNKAIPTIITTNIYMEEEDYSKLQKQ